MSKNKRKSLRTAAAASEANAEEAAFGKKGGAFLAIALAAACAGYFFLKKADPAGKNVWAVLAPVFLLAGYLLAPAALGAGKTGRKKRKDPLKIKP
jgi:hypothetical protein